MTATDVRVLRARYRITQRQLAQALGIPQTRLSHLENAMRPLPPALGDQIMRFFAAITTVQDKEAAHA